MKYQIYFFLSFFIVASLESMRQNNNQIILLNGSSCSGKTTIAKKISENLIAKKINHTIFSIDTLYAVFLQNLSKRQKADLPFLMNEAKEKKLSHPAMAFDRWNSAMLTLFDTWYAECFKTACEQVIIIEHTFERDSMFEQFLKSWANHEKPELLFVKISCNNFETIISRLQKRNRSLDTNEHRDVDSTIANFNTVGIIHNKEYDLEIDTQNMNATQAAQAILNYEATCNALQNNFKKFVHHSSTL